MDFVPPLSEIANCLGAPVCKYLQYHRKLNDYIKNLNRIRYELNRKMEDIDVQLKAELRHPGKVERKEVENWLKIAEEMITEAEAVENKVCNGRYLSRAYRGKLADKKTRELKEILGEAPNVSDGLVMDGPSVGLPLPTSELIGGKAVRDEIWRCLMQEEVSKIGVWGLGGVGKTTIMMHIQNDLIKEKRFDKVIWVTILKEFNVMKLQDDIALALRGGVLPKEREVVRAAILSKMLKKAKKHVLIFDDVWDKFSLEDVGVPEPTSSNGCKLVLTSRSADLCRYMGCKVIKVKPLSEEEALTLFLNKVGPNILQSSTLKPILKHVVKECAGLPLTIVVVAGTLKGKDDPRIWKTALNELKERKGKVEVEAEVIESLKFSFHRLESEKMKHCFLYCALYPKDSQIRKGELVECWIDEGFTDEMDTREKMKDWGHAILQKLEGNGLLENAGYADRVKMLNPVRDMALSVTRMNPRYMIKAGLHLDKLPKEEEWTVDIEKVSLMRNSMSEIPIDLSPPNCPLLTTLLLQHNPITRIPDSFFANMPSLSVLDLSLTKIECLPDSISELNNLTALLLGGCERLKHLPSLSKLQGLKKLDLSYTQIEKVAEGIEMLVNLRYLDLRVYTLKEIPAGLLPKLSRLQYLRFHERNEKTSVKVEEVVPLEKLECFYGCFKDMRELNWFVSLTQQCKKNFIECRLHVGSSVWVGEEKALSINELESCGCEIMLPNDIQELIISYCQYLKSLSDISSLENAIDLRNCKIEHCQGMESVLSFSFSSSFIHPFKSLERLHLVHLPNLSELIKVEGSVSSTSILAPPASLSHLKEISIMNCWNMKMLLPLWLLPNLQNLEVIRVGGCKQLVEILAAATSEDDEEEKGSDTLTKFNLPKLRELVLGSLPELKSICSRSGVMVCDSLQYIKVNDCCKLKRITPFLPLVGNRQPFAYAPPSLAINSSREWWESLEWDDPNFKNVLQPRWVLRQWR